MNRLEMVRAAFGELGDGATADEVVRLVAERFATEIGAKFIPVYRATLRAEAELGQVRGWATGTVVEKQSPPS
jgi:hypothetical protein